MANKDSKKRLFEVMERVAPNFKTQEEQNIQELQAVAATSTGTKTQTQQYGRQPDVDYADSTYKLIAPLHTYSFRLHESYICQPGNI